MNNNSVAQGLGTLPQRSLLDSLSDRINIAHKIIDDLQQIGDRIVGIREVVAAQPLAKMVPAGLLEEMLESACGLEDRLRILLEQFRRI